MEWPRPPAGYVRRLRQLADCANLHVRFNAARSVKEDRPVWSVLEKSPVTGRLHWIMDWIGCLDGNAEVIAGRLAAWDYAKNGGQKAYVRRLLARDEAREASKERSLHTTTTGIASHLRKLNQRIADGAPNLKTVF